MNFSKKAGMLLVASCILFLCSCKKETDCNGTTEKSFDATGFSRITAGSVMRLNIRNGDAYSIKASGCNREIDDLRVRVKSNNELEIDFDENRKRRSPVDVAITLPRLVALNLSGAAEGVINGFEAASNTMRFVLSGAAVVQVNGASVETRFDLSGASRLTLSGSTDMLGGTASGASELRAFNSPAKEVDISVSGGTKASVTALEKLFVEATGGSRVVYRGNPTVKEIVTSGGGAVVAE